MYATPHFISGSKWLVNIEQRPKRSRWMASVWPERKPSQGYENSVIRKHICSILGVMECVSHPPIHTGRGRAVLFIVLLCPIHQTQHFTWIHCPRAPSEEEHNPILKLCWIQRSQVEKGGWVVLLLCSCRDLCWYKAEEVWDRCPDECFMCGREVNLLVYIRKADDTLLPILHYNHQIILYCRYEHKHRIFKSVQYNTNALTSIWFDLIAYIFFSHKFLTTKRQFYIVPNLVQLTNTWKLLQGN